MFEALDREFRDMMIDAPSPIDSSQLKELSLGLKIEEKV